MGTTLRTASWVLMAVLGVITLLISFASAYLAYAGDYPIGGTAVAEVAAGRPEILTALRGIRGTSAAYGAGFAVLFLATVLGPYRRGDESAWWALLAAAVVVVLIAVARVPLLGVPFGAGGSGPAATQGAVILFALLLDVGRLRGR
jgi:hypothetical protein